MKTLLKDIHRELENALYPFDPIGFYVLVPFALILLYLFH